MSTDPYSENGVLKNKFGETNPKKLDILEKRYTARGWVKIHNELLATPNLKLDAALLKKIHKALFEDVYEWAGEYRTVNIVKGNTMFANALYVPAALDDLFTKLNREIIAKSITSNNISEKLAYYYGELNMIHPFREGNGRTQKIFIQRTAAKLGYYLDLEKADPKKLLEATIESVNGTGKPLEEIFEKITNNRNLDGISDKLQSRKPNIKKLKNNDFDLER